MTAEKGRASKLGTSTPRMSPNEPAHVDFTTKRPAMLDILLGDIALVLALPVSFAAVLIVGFELGRQVLPCFIGGAVQL